MGKRKTEKERMSTLPQLEKASRILSRAAKEASVRMRSGLPPAVISG